MAVYKSTGFDITPAVSGNNAGGVVAVNKSITLAAATKLSDGDLLKFIKVPAFHKVVDYKIDFPEVDMDDGTASLTWSAGLMDNTDTALDVAFTVDSTAGQTNAGSLVEPTSANIATLLGTAAYAVEKVFAIEVTATANGDSAAEGVINVLVMYAPA